jgi:hypothetical protein
LSHHHLRSSSPFVTPHRPGPLTPARTSTSTLVAAGPLAQSSRPTNPASPALSLPSAGDLPACCASALSQHTLAPPMTFSSLAAAPMRPVGAS